MASLSNPRDVAGRDIETEIERSQLRFSFKYPHFIVVAVLAVVTIGCVALFRILTDLLPTFKTPAVQILTFYPGMPTEVMERDLTTRLEIFRRNIVIQLT